MRRAFSLVVSPSWRVSAHSSHWPIHVSRLFARPVCPSQDSLLSGCRPISHLIARPACANLRGAQPTKGLPLPRSGREKATLRSRNGRARHAGARKKRVIRFGIGCPIASVMPHPHSYSILPRSFVLSARISAPHSLTHTTAAASADCGATPQFGQRKCSGNVSLLRRP